MSRFVAALMIVLMVDATATACRGGHSADKAGTRVSGTKTLRLEMPDAGDAQGQSFAAEVARRSGGSLQIKIDLVGYSSVLPANELKLARALEAGREDIAYLPARAWAAAGVPGFKALLAPFVITTDLTASRLADGPLATRVLATLPRSVIGIGLVPAELRRILATRPIGSARAFQGLRLRVIDNPQSAADFRALGVEPIQGVTSQRVAALFTRGVLDGVESAAGTVLSNSYFNYARNISAYAIFPKFQSIVVSRRVWDGLTPAQRFAIRRAAADTTAMAVRQLPPAERTDLTQLCESRVRISLSTDRGLRELQSAVRPVIATLARTAEAKTILEAIARLPGAGLQPLASPIPAVCLSGAHLQPRPTAKGAPSIPNGVYVVTDTAADWVAGGVINPELKTAITYVTTLRNGRFYQTQTPNYPDQGPFSGTYTVHGDTVTFTTLRAGSHGQNSVTAPETVKWSYFAGRLRFKVVTVADFASKVLYSAHPWRKVR